MLNMLVGQVELEFRYLYHHTMSILGVFFYFFFYYYYYYVLIQINILFDISKATALSSPGGGQKFVHFF